MPLNESVSSVEILLNKHFYGIIPAWFTILQLLHYTPPFKHKNYYVYNTAYYWVSGNHQRFGDSFKWIFSYCPAKVNKHRELASEFSKYQFWFQIYKVISVISVSDTGYSTNSSQKRNVKGPSSLRLSYLVQKNRIKPIYTL